jgi:polar amino acid transport system permease protein
MIGIVMGLCRVSRRLFNRLIGRTYVELIRNTPPLVLIFIFYYFLSGQIMSALGVDAFMASRSNGTQYLLKIFFAPPSMFSAFVSALITLALFEGAYITEIVRAGVQSIEKGIWEAAYALGLSRWQQLRYVVLPLAAQRILPSPGRPVYFHDQGLGYRFRHLHPGVNLPWHGTHVGDLSDL